MKLISYAENAWPAQAKFCRQITASYFSANHPVYNSAALKGRSFFLAFWRPGALVICLLQLLLGTEAYSDDPRSKIRQLIHDTSSIEQTRLSSGKIGIGLIPRNYDDSKSSWFEALQVANLLGVQALQLPAGYWHEDEPKKGEYNWRSMERFIDALQSSNIELEIIQDFGGPFIHDRITAPGYLKDRNLNDPELVQRYVEYLESYLSRFADHITTLLIHTEGATSYFQNNSLEDYIEFLRVVRTHLRTHYPHVQLGINTDPHNRPEVLSALSRQVDIMAFDIVTIEGFLDTPEDLSRVIDYVLDHTEGRPVSLTGGWSSESKSGIGEIQQVEFLKQWFTIVKGNRDRIRYAMVGPLFDENVELVAPAYRAQFSHLPDQFVADIINWITRLGWIRPDGVAKPAWEEAQRQIKQYYRSVASRSS